jgi:integrase
LTRPELDAVLTAFNRQTAVGKRDYAMFLLLATYGLRGIEVVRRTLDDVRWREQLLRVHGRKAGNSTTSSLSAAAGDALLVYLQAIRPASPHRELFLTMHAPLTPLLRVSLRNRKDRHRSYTRISEGGQRHPAEDCSSPGASETSIWMGKGSKKSKANRAAGRRFKAYPAVFYRMWASG